jgi:hypothetical protein
MFLYTTSTGEPMKRRRAERPARIETNAASAPVCFVVAPVGIFVF